jgi:hypothetical protein
MKTIASAWNWTRRHIILFCASPDLLGPVALDILAVRLQHDDHAADDRHHRAERGEDDQDEEEGLHADDLGRQQTEANGEPPCTQSATSAARHRPAARSDRARRRHRAWRAGGRRGRRSARGGDMRARQAEQRLEDALDVGRGEQVHAARYQRHPHRGIVEPPRDDSSPAGRAPCRMMSPSASGIDRDGAGARIAPCQRPGAARSPCRRRAASYAARLAMRRARGGDARQVPG